MRALIEKQWVQALIVVGVCALVYWPLLGRGGLAMSEGHRVIPAWEMLDSGDWWTPTMFGAAYVRKPPGMSWAIAASSMVFGETVFAARAVSALAMTLMSLAAWRAATSWFGSPWGLAAGLAAALMPQFWESGRSAEIEALNNLGTLIAALAAIEIVTCARAGARARIARTLTLAVGIGVMGLAKGPAGAPVVLGAVAGGVWATGRARAIARAELWTGLALGVVLVGGVVAGVWRAVDASGLEVVAQSPGAFLWEPGRTGRVLALPLEAWAWALPASLALVFPWGPDARAEAGDERARLALARARALAVAWVIAIGVELVAGVSNARYAAPSAGLAAVLCAYVWRGAFGDGRFTPRRRAIARFFFLYRAWVWPSLLLIGAWAFILTREAGVRGTSGEDAGVELARVIERGVAEGSIARGAVVFACDAIEARPEVVASARRALARAGVDTGVEFRWAPGGLGDGPTAEGMMSLVRLDEGSPEAGLPSLTSGWWELGRFDVHKYTLGLYLHVEGE